MIATRTPWNDLDAIERRPTPTRQSDHGASAVPDPVREPPSEQAQRRDCDCCGDFERPAGRPRSRAGPDVVLPCVNGAIGHGRLLRHDGLGCRTERLDQFRLDGRVAPVTGGASSLGRSIARGLTETGAAIVIASRDLERCEALASELQAAGRLQPRLSRYPGHVDDFAEASLEASLRVEATGFFAVTQRCVREMARAYAGTSSTSPPRSASAALCSTSIRRGWRAFARRSSSSRPARSTTHGSSRSSMHSRGIRANCMSTGDDSPPAPLPAGRREAPRRGVARTP